MAAVGKLAIERAAGGVKQRSSMLRAGGAGAVVRDVATTTTVFVPLLLGWGLVYAGKSLNWNLVE